uniref:SDR family NAD(P)-dependent oxidoreductase n=1 Tax=Thaumasiovibrio occultus TaxID=1891184 RepID=UPI00131DA83E
MDVDNKSVVITGAAGGLGQTMAASLSRRGAKVSLIDVEDVSAVVKNCQMLNGEVRGYRCDITSEHDVRET